MPTYVIGDVQGCYAELRSLLRTCRFDARHDELWFAGDLVNRGPDSLGVLRFVADLGERARVVLGNHDLHLVASAAGARKPGAKDTFQDVLGAADGEALIDWLRRRPLVHSDPGRRFVMVHAGIPPAWTVGEAFGHADALSRALRAADRPRLLKRMYGNGPDRWRDSLAGFERLRFIANAFTRMRYCRMDGTLDFSETRPARRSGPLAHALVRAARRRSGPGEDRVRALGDASASQRPAPEPARPPRRHRVRMGWFAHRAAPRRRSGVQRPLQGRRPVNRPPMTRSVLAACLFPGTFFTPRPAP